MSSSGYEPSVIDDLGFTKLCSVIDYLCNRHNESSDGTVRKTYSDAVVLVSEAQQYLYEGSGRARRLGGTC